ncbi:hypothetical protein R50072_11780 [Simiduia litorea]|uniref:serine protease n=1 Tax=Simiduia litorea TaxID=1435348 RepID=UPI0036F1ED01
MRVQTIWNILKIVLSLGVMMYGFSSYAQNEDGGSLGAEGRLIQELLQSRISPLQVHTLGESLPQLSSEYIGSVPARITLSEIQSSKNGEVNNFNFFRSIRGEKIVGGDVVGDSEVPWQVALVLPGYPPSSGQFCGGSILDELWVLTAAHCVDNMTAKQVNIYSGSVVLSGSVGTMTPVKHISVHPQWNSRTMENDIALIKLEAKLKIVAGKAVPVLLPGKTEVVDPGSIVTVTGWGATTEGGASSRSLKKVNVPVVSFSDCNSSAFYAGEVLGGMLCAGIGGKDSCQGDSGGPLVRRLNGNQTTQLGVVSWGYGCARPNKPGVYTDVSKFTDWIASRSKL